MTVGAPRADLQGTIIQGYLVEARQQNGRMGVAIDFNRIRPRNGRAAAFIATGTGRAARSARHL